MLLICCILLAFHFPHELAATCTLLANVIGGFTQEGTNHDGMIEITFKVHKPIAPP
jgi:hypothetical protein